MTNLFTNSFVTLDAPRPWGLYFQDSASPQMEALIELHDNIMFYLSIILFGVAWILASIIRNYVNSKSPISNKYLNHGTLIELIWTISPALILILIAFPSFKLLYLMDEVTDPSLTVSVEGHQWYWSYQYPDFFYDELNLFADSSESEAGSNESDSEGNSNEGSLDIPDSLDQVDQTISNCTHNDWQPYVDDSQDAVDTTVCDFNPMPLDNGRFLPHNAFVEGRAPSQCLNCFAIICEDCLDPDTEEEHSGSVSESNSSLPPEEEESSGGNSSMPPSNSQD